MISAANRTIYMELTQQQLKRLKSLAHPLKPIVSVGQQGMKETIHTEINVALDYHQLVKIKISGAERDEKATMCEDIIKKHKALLVQSIGNILVIYRRNKKKDDITKKTSL